MEHNKLVYHLGELVKVENIKFDGQFYQGNLQIDDENVITYVINENENIVDVYEGKIICLVVFKNSDAKYLIVGNKNTTINYAEIKGYFKNNKKFDSDDVRFRCLYEVATGIIAYTKKDDEIKYLVMYSRKGFAGFPKGHMEFGESEIETAEREFKEEMGFSLKIVDNYKQEVDYTIDDTPINKKVIFFTCENDDFTKVNINQNEVSKVEILSLDEAKQVLHENLIPIIENVDKYIKEKGI